MESSVLQNVQFIFVSFRFGKRGPQRFGKRGSMQLNAPDWPTDMTEDQI